MKIILLAAGAAVALSSGLAVAGTVPSPQQPIPYAKLDAYLKASPKLRARTDWWSGEAAAATDAAANTSATAGADVRKTPDAGPAANNPSTSVNPPSLPSTPPVDAPPTPGAVNPWPSAAPGAPPPATPPK